MEPPLTSLHVLVGPLLALLLVLLLGGLLRWTYGTHRQHVAPRDPDEAADGDLGLLRRVAVVPGPEQADAIRRLLAAEGVRATRRPAPGGGQQVLVFARDEADARVVLAGSGWAASPAADRPGGD